MKLEANPVKDEMQLLTSSLTEQETHLNRLWMFVNDTDSLTPREVLSHFDIIFGTMTALAELLTSRITPEGGGISPSSNV